MKTRAFLLGTILATAVAFSAPAKAEAVLDDTPSGEAMAFDLFIARPLGLVGTVAGTAIYLVALPINLITLNLAEPAQVLIVNPLRYTFVRELGAD